MIKNVKVSSSFQRIQKLILSFQHLIAMFGATVLVPILTGFNPSVALFTAGVGTLIFHKCTEGKVPVFLGSSFAFIPIILTIKETTGSLAYAQGGMFAAGFFYVLLSFVIKKIGLKRIKRILPAHIVGPMIIVIGLSLIPTALNMAQQHYLIAGITLLTALVITIFGKGFIKQLAILIAIVVGCSISASANLIEFAPIAEANLLNVPPFQLPKFDVGSILITIPVVLAVFMEHLGDITTNGQVVGKNFIENPGLNKTLLGDGLATMFASLVGGPANTTYGENTGVLAITKNYDPSILRLAAILAVVLGFFSKFGAILSSIPNAVMGGISLMLFSMIALIGVKTIRNEKVDFNLKNSIVIMTILIIGLGELVGLNIYIKLTSTVSIAGLSLAAIIGILMNIVFDVFMKRKQTRK